MKSVSASNSSPDWSAPLLQWYGKNKRTLPWRVSDTSKNVNPYHVWISEIMLQQTRVDSVIPYFKRFLIRFPTLPDLAEADLQEVLKIWQGLGYYSRARNLHAASHAVLERWNGVLPQTYDDLRSLPGFGPYTAAAVASIAFGQPHPVVDGNVLRVFSRFWGIEDDIKKTQTRINMVSRLQPAIDGNDPSTFNQAIMELGALICLPKSPSCGDCPLQNLCTANQENRTDELPVKSKRPKIPHYDVAIGVIWKKDRILVARRRTDQMLGGLWEFPGGKQQPGESLEETAQREILEETGLTVDVGEKITVVKHAYTHFKITLTAFRCEVVKGKATALVADEVRWIRPDEINTIPVPKASLLVIKAVLASIGEATPYS